MNDIGLILEGGGMRGVFTAGVLDFFLDQGIHFSKCLGVSAGACHACSYLAGQRGRAFAISTDYLDDRRYCSLYSLLTTGDLFGVQLAYHEIPDRLYPIDNAAFRRSGAAFQAVVTNCETGKAEYPVIRDLKKDIDYVRASSSLPLLANIVTLNGRPYLDGGIADSIPLRRSIRQGCVKNVVVLTQHRAYRKQKNKLLPLLKVKYRAYPQLLRAVETRHLRYNRTLLTVAAEERSGRAFVIAPPQPLGLGRIEKDREKLKAAYQSGYDEAARRYTALKAFLAASPESECGV
ncbi:MAG: patatin family protein [Clostridiales bacterium]|nr:MAG: patatin family protein [Clostridiales bacterium]